jgi:hypothetical protein
MQTIADKDLGDKEMSQQQEINLNEQIIVDIVKLIEQHQRATFRDLRIGLSDSVTTQEIWALLRILQGRKVIESCKISNTRTGYKLQYAYANSRCLS